MKKNNIFRHELNESIQANAAMNCLKNRNKHKQLNEFHPAGLARIALPLLKPVIRKIVANLVSKMGAKAITGSRLIHTVMSKLNAGTIAKVAQKIGQTWTEVPEELKQEIWDFAVHTFKELSGKEKVQPQLANQEQEESADYDKDAVAMNLVKKSKNTLKTSWAEAPEMFILQKVRRMLCDAGVVLRWTTGLVDWVKAICNACDAVLGKTNDREIKTLITYELRYHYLEQDVRKLAQAASHVIEKTGDKPASFNVKEINAWIREHDNDFRRVLFGSQEQEEGADEKATFALKLVKKFKNRMTPDYAKRPEMYMMLKLQNALKKPLMSLSKEEYRAWAKAICDACESVFGSTQEQEESTDEKYAIAKQVMANYNPDTDEWEDPSVWLLYAIQDHIGKQFLGMPKKELKSWKQAIDATITEYEKEQEEHSEDEARLQSQLANAWDEGMEDDEDDYVPYENKFDETHHDIVDNLISAVEYYFDTDDDVSGFYRYDYTEDQLGKAVEKVLDKYDDFPSSNNFDKCYAWVRKHAEEIVKILETGSLDNSYEGHPEFDFSEQEELPQMERHDMILTLTQYLDECWIDSDEDGDLDDLYYAVAKVLDKTGDYPASTNWEDCKPWCQKHYREVEETFLGGGF